MLRTLRNEKLQPATLQQASGGTPAYLSFDLLETVKKFPAFLVQEQVGSFVLLPFSGSLCIQLPFLTY